MRCGACGTDNEVGSRFCGSCGASVVAPPPASAPVGGRSTMVSEHPIASKVAAAAALARRTPSVSLGVSAAKPRGIGGRVWALLLLDIAMLAGAATLVAVALRSDRQSDGNDAAPVSPVATLPPMTTLAVASGSGDIATAHSAGTRAAAHSAAPIAPAVVGVAPSSASAPLLDGDAGPAPAPAQMVDLLDPTAVAMTQDAGVASAPLDAASAPFDAEPDDPHAAGQADEIGLLSRRSQKHFDRCYTLASKGLPADQPLSGQVGVSFQIMPNGQVSSVAVGRDTTGAAQLGRCLVSEISSWHFAASDATAPASFVRTFRFDAPK